MFIFRKSLVRIATVASLALLCAAPSRGQEKVQLRLNLQKGQTYDQVIAMQQKVSQTIQKQRMDISTQTRFGLRMEVLESNSDGTLKIKTTYQSAQMDNRFSGLGDKVVESHYDSLKPNNKKDESSQVIAAMIGQSVTTTVSPRGETLKIEGWDKLAQRIVDSLKIPAAQRVQMLEIMENSMKSQTGQTMGLATFPEMPIGVGDSWTSQISQTSTIPILLATRYTLAAVENGIAILNVQSKISYNANSIAFGTPSSKVNTDFSGTQNGVMRVDERTGLMQSTELRQRFSGQTSITNPKISKTPITIPMYFKSTIRAWMVTPPR